MQDGLRTGVFAAAVLPARGTHIDFKYVGCVFMFSESQQQIAEQDDGVFCWDSCDSGKICRNLSGPVSAHQNMIDVILTTVGLKRNILTLKPFFPCNG